MKPLDPRLLRYARGARTVLGLGGLFGVLRTLAVITWCWCIAQALAILVLPVLGGAGGATGKVAEHAYRSTLADLHLRRTELEPVLARHGLGLDAALVADTRRGLLDSVRPASARSSSATTRLRQALDELESSVATASAVRRLRTPAALANR